MDSQNINLHRDAGQPAAVSDLLCSECNMVRSRRFGLVVQFDKPRFFSRGAQIIEIAHRSVFVCFECLRDLWCGGLGYTREDVLFFIEEYGPRNLHQQAEASV